MNDYIIKSVPSEMLSEYCKVPISYEANTVLEVISPENCFDGFILKEKNVESFEKDYDKFETPLIWPKEFDLTNWKFYIAYMNDQPVGAATLVMKSNEIRMLEGKSDLACLWDIRVHPDWRGKGIGSALFQRVASDAKESGCNWLKVETQNINPGANKFYKKQGGRLTHIHTKAYYDDPECKNEVMLIWYLDLRM